MLYKTLKRMIERGQTEGLREKLDVLFAAGRISNEEFQELTELLGDV